MRIAFVWDWENDLFQMATWRDGLAAAIRILSKRHDLKFFTCGKAPFVFPHDYFDIHVVPEGDAMVAAVADHKPDVILMWGDATRPNAAPLKTLGLPMALCFAGGNPFGPTWHLFDHIFVESQSYLFRYQERGIKVSTAFGTNTELFTPVPDQQKQFDVIFPATYANWKRHHLLAAACKGMRVVTSGFMYQDHEQWCWQAGQKAGFLTLPHVSAETMRYLYAASKVCVIPSETVGGSQRTVLEAMAMNVPLVVMSDSDKTSEYVNDCGIGESVLPVPEEIRAATYRALDQRPNTREYVMRKWSETCYADALEEGLVSIMPK